MDNAPADSRPRRPRGRPRKEDAPVVDWQAVDAALVFGEVVEDPKTGRKAVKYPSLRELGQRWGVAGNRIWQYSHRHHCMRRREEARLKVQERFEEKVVEKIAEARALATADVIELVDDYLRGFKRSLREGKVRCDSPSDVDRLVRLKELLVGNADSRQELQGGLTLEGIQARHQRLQTQLEGLTAELAGEVSHSPRGQDGDALH